MSRVQPHLTLTPPHQPLRFLSQIQGLGLAHQKHEQHQSSNHQIRGSRQRIISLFNKLVSVGVPTCHCFSLFANYRTRIYSVEALFLVLKRCLQKVLLFSYGLIFRIQLNFKLETSLSL